MASRKKTEPTKYYINRAKMMVEETEKLLQAVKRCINESEGFPIYLSDLQDMVNNLMYLNVAHNAIWNEHYDKLKQKQSKPKRR